MVFSSLTFLYIALPVALAVYYLLPRALRNPWLLLFSLWFYGCGEPVYIFLMLFSICANWGFALLIGRYPAWKRGIVAFAAFINVGLLVVFKYSALLVSTLNAVSGLQLPVPEISLPIGISFFTFQALAYVLDVYRGEIGAVSRWDRVALSISLFPQLIAGPIVRYADIAGQIEHRRETLAGFASGMERFIVGLSKKVLIANALAPLADEAFSLAGQGLGAAGAWLGIFSYAFQIYFDFSGYSDMAIGLGLMFGFGFKENFNDPYISCSIKEFWSRWHISLSTWFRDYVYIPLGGNRVKRKARHMMNIAVVFLLTGIWHGASWTFLLWGAYHGFFRMLEELPKIRLPKFVRWLFTLLVVLVGWVIFRADSLAQAVSYLLSMIGMGNARYLTSVTPRALLMLAAGAMASYPWRLKLSGKLRGAVAEIIRWPVIVLLLLLSMATLAAGTYNPFIYFRF